MRSIIRICIYQVSNKTLRALLDDCESTNHSTFTEAISKAADKTLVDKERPRPDWFNLSKTILLEAIAKLAQSFVGPANI